MSERRPGHFVRERHEVGHRAERDEVEHLAKIEVRDGPLFQQGVRELEDDADAA